MAIAKGYTPYGGLLEHHLRIGDTEFYVPPTAISVHRQMKNKRAKILRARNSLPKESGYFDRVIELTLFFPDMDAINTELRPLLAQVKKCPFLPIENTYLNDIHKIDGVTISGVTVQTTPGFPHTLQAQIQLYAFEPASYIADEDDRTFDEMFNWPLFRWYYQRNLDPESAGMFNTYYEPLYDDLDNTFKFRIAAMDDLDAMATWRKEKKNLIKNYMEDKREKFWGKEKREGEFDKSYDEINERAMFEYNIHYEDWDIPGLVLTDFSVGFENSITSLQLQDDASPTHQYMGSQDTIMVARFKTDNAESIASLESLLHRATYMIRNYHKEVSNGFLEFDHQLARLFGVKNVTIEDVQTNTIDGQPGSYEVSITMIAYNRMERKLSEVNWISESAEWDIDKYENQGFWSLITSMNPLNWDFGMSDGAGALGNDIDSFSKGDLLYDAPLISPLARWGRFLWDMPAVEQAVGGLKIWAKGHDRSAARIDEEDIKNIIYDESIQQFFRMAEVYPDLELPTYGEAAVAGFDIENTNNGVFVEPDFFIDYKKGTMFYEDLLAAMGNDYRTVLRDSSGGEVEMQADKVVKMNKITQDEIDNSRSEFDRASENSQVAHNPIVEQLIDKGNVKKSDMEALIREKAKEVGLNQNFPLAFARVMDEEMKHFYEKGTNAKQGKVVNQQASTPVMMNKDFAFYTNQDGSVDGEYIGVMKVRRMYGSNVNMLGKNIEYNIESGVRKMAEFYGEVERIHANSANGTKKIYNEKNVYDLFGLKGKKGTFDFEKARFVGVLMMYLGFQKEYTALIKENKKPPAKVISLIKRVLEESVNQDEWTTEQIQKKVKDLPIKDFKSGGAQGRATKSPMDVKDFKDDEKIHHGMMDDMLRYDKRGRLVRAYPTFFMTFVDEGQHIGSVKLSDQYFQYQAVMDIMYTNSRKEASSTLVLEMSNVFGTLDDAEKGMDLATTSLGEVFKAATMPGAVAREAERSRHRNPNHYKSIMLRTGTRIHFRMGYGSNVMNMPTIMNGTITSIQNNGESITVIAQDDGIELTNKIRADVNETTDGGFLFSKKEPTEIVDEILTDSQGFFKNMWAGLSNKEFEGHSLGIMHFGSQGSPQGWAALGIAFANDARPKSEINMNVHQTTGLTNKEHDGWWNKVEDAFGFGQADEPGINISLYDKSVWDVLNIAASIGDDHIVAVHPFGFRNTIFSGKTYFPLHYDYLVEGETVKGTAVKPFRQFRVYDSTTSILDNTIQATEENIRTVAVGVFMNEGEMDTTSPIYVDTNIWPEKQRTVNIDTTLNAQGIRLVENIPLVGGLLNKPNKWYHDEGVAIKIAARGLSDYVRDMYDGYLTVIGDPSVKPYDQMWIYDTYNDISGPADVKEVTHIMNHDLGFITMLKPDAVVVNSDRRSIGFMMAALNIAGTAAFVHMLRKKLQNSKYAGNLPILNSLWAVTASSIDRMKGRFKSSKVTGKLYDKLTGKMPKNLEEVKASIKSRTMSGSKASDVLRWKKNGMLDKLQNLTSEDARNDFENLLKNSKKFSLNSAKNVKLKMKASKLMASGGKKLRTVASGAKLLWSGAHVAAGPIGWIALAIETLAVHIVASTVGEFTERFLFTRQACLIAPLTKGGEEFSAGINGHKGSVVGDSPDFWQGALTNPVISSLLYGILGANTSQYSQEEREGEIQSKASSGASFDMDKLAQSIHNRHRAKPRDTMGTKELYDKDRKAALEQVNKRLELLSSRDTKAVHKEEDTTWDEWKDKVGDWFTGLWDKVKDIFGSKDDGGVCIPTGDVSTGGRAKGLSKHFSVIGPKIDAEAKLQGLSQYAEIIKAKCMQESGGNYLKYPDVMQASESLGKPIGYIKNVDASIKQGVKYFGQIIKRCNGDIKLALQSYNYGSGFIDYAMKRGGKYTPDLAYQFAVYMVNKMGRKISRIAPGYGDSKYVERVLRYYDGNLPSGDCEGSTTMEGSSSYPTVLGKAGKMKYKTSGAGLIDLRSYAGRTFGITLAGGTSKVRPGTAEALARTANLYKKNTGKKFNITSGNRPGDSNWHGTGWAVDIDTPNTMKIINGKMRFTNNRDKNDARSLCEAAVHSGFRELWFGDWDIVSELNRKYGRGTATYDPSGHWNHLHCSYPISKQTARSNKMGGPQQV